MLKNVILAIFQEPNLGLELNKQNIPCFSLAAINTEIREVCPSCERYHMRAYLYNGLTL